MPKLLAGLEHLTDIGKSSEQEQTEINVLEVAHIWDSLVSRYYVLEETLIFKNFCQDKDLHIILNAGIKILKSQIKKLEKYMKHYAIIQPKRPPENIEATTNPEVISDEYIFRRIFTGMQIFIEFHARAFIQSPSPKLREQFKQFLLEEINIYDTMFEYGKLKSWINEPPAFRP
ncbi:MAG: DUF3231 family protein [Dehalobacterium sp.]